MLRLRSRSLAGRFVRLWSNEIPGNARDLDARYNPSEMLPLQNRRILITRARQQASALKEQLEALGAVVIAIPTIEIVPPHSYDPLDQAIAQLDRFGWLVFTSANAVEVFVQRLRSEKPIADIVSLPMIAVIGPATARAVEEAGLAVMLQPPHYVAESLAEALTPYAKGSRMLLVRAEEARDVLPEALTRAGALVSIASAYRNQIPMKSMEEIREIFAASDSRPDVITFTSASTARNFAALLEGVSLGLPAEVALVSIGPITSQAIREVGYEPTIEAEEPTIPALVEAVVQLLSRNT